MILKKILVVSDWQWKMYGEAFYKAFSGLGYEVDKFSWDQYFVQYQTDQKAGFLQTISHKFQNKYLMGPILRKINRDLYRKCLDFKPDMIFIYRGTHVFPETIKSVKLELECKVFGYNNDDPFSKEYSSYVWKNFLKSIPMYDHIFVYREKNIQDYEDISYKKTSLLRSYYIADSNFPIRNIENSHYTCDVVFIGHFENDGRDEALKLLIENGVDVRLYGTQWEKSKHYSFFKEKYKKIVPVYGDTYNLAINSAKIALVFLSKLNNDTYTRRCFEIPATKTMMVSEYTSNLAKNLFKEGIEAEYFRDKEELFIKVTNYLLDKRKIDKIGNAGYIRLKNDGHEVVDRVKEIIQIYNRIKK